MTVSNEGVLNGSQVQKPSINGAGGLTTNGSHHEGPTQVDLADRVHVLRSDQAFCSMAVSKIDLPAGSVFALLSAATPATKAYTSVQVSEDAHIELNSDLVFCNHSCAPTVEFDMARMLVRVVKDRDLKKGDPLTFFYPSSEWDMAQPFDCTCGAGKGVCCGIIRGAKDMDETVLRRYWLNEHIERMLQVRTAERKASSGDKAVNGVKAVDKAALPVTNGVTA